MHFLPLPANNGALSSSRYLSDKTDFLHRRVYVFVRQLIDACTGFCVNAAHRLLGGALRRRCRRSLYLRRPGGTLGLRAREAGKAVAVLELTNISKHFGA